MLIIMIGTEGVDRLLRILMAWRPKAMPSVPACAALSKKQCPTLFFLTTDPLGFDSVKKKENLIQRMSFGRGYKKDIFRGLILGVELKLGLLSY